MSKAYLKSDHFNGGGSPARSASAHFASAPYTGCQGCFRTAASWSLDFNGGEPLIKLRKNLCDVDQICGHIRIVTGERFFDLREQIFVCRHGSSRLENIAAGKTITSRLGTVMDNIFGRAGAGGGAATFLGVRRSHATNSSRSTLSIFCTIGSLARALDCDILQTARADEVAGLLCHRTLAEPQQNFFGRLSSTKNSRRFHPLLREIRCRRAPRQSTQQLLEMPPAPRLRLRWPYAAGRSFPRPMPSQPISCPARAGGVGAPGARQQRGL